MNNVCIVQKTEGTQCDVTVTQQGPNNFTVIYGKQVKPRLTYAQAAREFGECVFHSLACIGQLNR